MRDWELCGHLVNGDPARPCLMKRGHKRVSHVDFLEREKDRQRHAAREYLARQRAREQTPEYREKRNKRDRERYRLMAKYGWGKCSKCGKKSCGAEVIVCQECRRKARVRVCALKGCNNQFDTRNQDLYCSHACYAKSLIKEHVRKQCVFCSSGFEVDSAHRRQQTCLRTACVTGYRVYCRYGWSPVALAARAAVEETIQEEKRRKWAVEVIERQRRMIRMNNGLL